MARINALNINEAGDASATLEAVQKKIGMVPNIYGSMAHSPAVLNALLGFNGALAEGVLDAGLREAHAFWLSGTARSENYRCYCIGSRGVLNWKASYPIQVFKS